MDLTQVIGELLAETGAVVTASTRLKPGCGDHAGSTNGSNAAVQGFPPEAQPALSPRRPRPAKADLR